MNAKPEFTVRDRLLDNIEALLANDESVTCRREGEDLCAIDALLVDFMRHPCACALPDICERAKALGYSDSKGAGDHTGENR